MEKQDLQTKSKLLGQSSDGLSGQNSTSCRWDSTSSLGLLKMSDFQCKCSHHTLAITPTAFTLTQTLSRKIQEKCRNIPDSHPFRFIRERLGVRLETCMSERALVRNHTLFQQAELHLLKVTKKRSLYRKAIDTAKASVCPLFSSSGDFSR